MIRAEELGKRYHRGELRSAHGSLKEAVTQVLMQAFRGSDGDGVGGDEFWALKDVSFEVRRGEALGIIGRNGSGKSTLLKILARITPPTEGYAQLRGRVAALLEVGTGFQPELTGRDNIYLNGAILGLRRGDIQSRFDEIVEFAEIGPFLDTPVKRYSSGMYIRLAFAVAAHLEPDVLIADEVLAVGDIAFQRKCLDRLHTTAYQGRTVLFVSHNVGNVEALCPNSIYLEGGRVKAAGKTPDVLKAYHADVGTRTTEPGQPIPESSTGGGRAGPLLAPPEQVREAARRPGG
jgi:ABC-type polysaccharide/polyol phosphate transport system ATPase subunit